MNKTLFGIALVITLLAGSSAAFAATTGTAVAVPINTSSTSLKTTSTDKPSIKSYTMTNIAKHATAKSCWTVVNNNVYDVTKFIGKHPGGQKAIKSLCGKDGTKQFTRKHGGKGRPESELKKLLIGTVKKA